MKDIEKLMRITSVLLVLLVELLNTAVESVVNRISMEHHLFPKLAKDTGCDVVMLNIFIFALTDA